MDSAHCREFQESCFLYHNAGCKLIASVFYGGSESSGNWTWRYSQHFQMNRCTSSVLAHAKGSQMCEFHGLWWGVRELKKTKHIWHRLKFQLLVKGITVDSHTRQIRSKLTSCPNHCKLTSGKHSFTRTLIYSFSNPPISHYIQKVLRCEHWQGASNSQTSIIGFAGAHQPWVECLFLCPPFTMAI